MHEAKIRAFQLTCVRLLTSSKEDSAVELWMEHSLERKSPMRLHKFRFRLTWGRRKCREVVDGAQLGAQVTDVPAQHLQEAIDPQTYAAIK